MYSSGAVNMPHDGAEHLTREQASRFVADRRALDEALVLIGYMDGFGGAPPAGGNSPSYLHGWRNGVIESGRMMPDRAYRDLKRAFEISGLDSEPSSTRLT